MLNDQKDLPLRQLTIRCCLARNFACRALLSIFPTGRFRGVPAFSARLVNGRKSESDPKEEIGRDAQSTGYEIVDWGTEPSASVTTVQAK
jgi:hypothetical protein